MAIQHSRVHAMILDLLRNHDRQELLARLRTNDAPFRKVPGGTRMTDEALKSRWDLLSVSAEAKNTILDADTLNQREVFQKNIENFIGTVKVPIGLAGPLRVNGLHAHGDYYVPMATTEAALVASYSRGAQVITEAGGCSAILLSEGISRAPSFAFRNLQETASFVAWIMDQVDKFVEVAATTTRHGKLVDMRVTVEGSNLYVNFEYETGDASGQNMVTIATEAICDYILEAAPVKPLHYFVESGLSGDKKANALAFTTVRGKKVTAEVIIPGHLVEKRFHTTPHLMQQYWSMCAVGSALIGCFGIQGHYANGLAAVFMACGQDVACVAESATGVTRIEVTDKNELYAAVTLPNIMVGTVGGGTGLPSQKACLEMMGLHGNGKAKALAEVITGVVLAGELSIGAALACGEFTRAHQRLARGRHKQLEAAAAAAT